MARPVLENPSDPGCDLHEPQSSKLGCIITITGSQTQHSHIRRMPDVPSFFCPGSRTTSEVVVRSALGPLRETTSEETSDFFCFVLNPGVRAVYILGSRRSCESTPRCCGACRLASPRIPESLSLPYEHVYLCVRDPKTPKP